MNYQQKKIARTLGLSHAQARIITHVSNQGRMLGGSVTHGASDEPYASQEAAIAAEVALRQIQARGGIDVDSLDARVARVEMHVTRGLLHDGGLVHMSAAALKKKADDVDADDDSEDLSEDDAEDDAEDEGADTEDSGDDSDDSDDSDDDDPDDDDAPPAKTAPKPAPAKPVKAPSPARKHRKASSPRVTITGGSAASKMRAFVAAGGTPPERPTLSEFVRSKSFMAMDMTRAGKWFGGSK